VSLTDSRTSRVLWSERRAFAQDEMREIGRDIVIGVLASIGEPATDEEKRIIGGGFPSSAEAYEEFLTGNAQLARRSPPSIESALHHYRRASELDTKFAAALARQAYGYAVLVDWGWKPSKDLPADMLSEGMLLADRAIGLDSTSADAWLARAYILRQRDPRKFAGSIEAFEHAITLDPYNAEAFHQYGQALMALGRYTEAYAAYRRSLDLEPGRATELVPMAALDERRGRLHEGTVLLDSAVAAAPQVGYVRAMRSMFRSQAGNFKGAQDDATDALALDSSYRMPGLTALARSLWLAGDKSRALTVVAEAERSVSNPSAPDPTEAFWLAMAEVATQRPEKAVTLLRNSKPRGAWLWFYFGASDLNEFRKRPEVSELMAELDPRR
ncbi:MAG TPA: tetratricopeptide repeat protein, partial [Gemmatimonadaceae bacterium]|nr:tetratricopeptide repeat protein [Gemmatimonadaceae bacterium]